MTGPGNSLIVDGWSRLPEWERSPESNVAIDGPEIRLIACPNEYFPPVTMWSGFEESDRAEGNDFGCLLTLHAELR